MRDRLLLPLMVLTGLGMIALSTVWPQGEGASSPPPFGHPLAPLQTEAPALPKPSFDPLRAIVQPAAKSAAPSKPDAAMVAPKKPAAKKPDPGLRPAQ